MVRKKATIVTDPKAEQHQHAIYFTSLLVENVRAFGDCQRFDLIDANGAPASWTLILGENGTGKTTLLQCLARMQPFPQWKRGSNGKVEVDLATADKAPDYVEPELLQFENEDLVRFLRDGSSNSKTVIKATFVYGAGLEAAVRAKRKTIEIGATLASQDGKLDKVATQQQHFSLPDPGPLVIGYGASRHVGHLNRTRVQTEHPSSSLFKDATDLYDAEEILRDLHHAALDAKDRKAQASTKSVARPVKKPKATPDELRLGLVLAAVADLLPEKSPDDIKIMAPMVPGREISNSGVQVLASGNWTPLGELSIGYQTVFAWTVDLAWRLLERYPKSENPMREPAIVLIDEIDLHLHPRWQRDLRQRLTSHFPNVQFIATTHSPFMAQDALTAGTNLLLVDSRGIQGSEIVTDAVAVGDWRLDQVATSRLFGLQSARAKPIEESLERRRAYIARNDLTDEERQELKRLDAFVARLPTASTPEEQVYEDQLRAVTDRIKAEHRRT